MGPEFYDHAVQHVTNPEDLMFLGLAKTAQDQLTHQLAIVVKASENQDVTVLSADTDPANNELITHNFSLAPGQEDQIEDVHSGPDTSEEVLDLRSISTFIGPSALMLTESMDEPGSFSCVWTPENGEPLTTEMYLEDPFEEGQPQA